MKHFLIALIVGAVAIMAVPARADNTAVSGANAVGTNTATNAASNSGVTSGAIVEFGDTDASGRRIPVSTAYAPPVYPTATCLGGVSGGLQIMGTGLTAGTSTVDEECRKLETARSWDNLPGHTDDAVYVRCQAKHNEGAPSCVALRKKQEEQASLDKVLSPLVQTSSNQQAYVERKFLGIQ
jgi:hypothetical protein